MRTLTRVLTLALLAGLPFVAAAEIYKYVDSNGVIRYTDTPPDKNAKPVELPPLQTYTSGDGSTYRNDEETGQDSILSLGPFGYNRVVLVSPSAEQVFNNANPQIDASAQVEPGLQPGHRVVFLVDGLPFPAPEGSSSLELANLERGSHTLQAVVMDGRDAIQIQSEPINFHLHKPSTLRPTPLNSPPKP